MKKINKIVFLIITVIALSNMLVGAAKKSLTLTDIMKFKEIVDLAISENGQWVAYSAWPDRGDGYVKIRSTGSSREYLVVRGKKPLFSKNGKWTGVILKPEFMKSLNQKKGKKSRDGMALVNTVKGEINQFKRVKRFHFSADSRWLAVYHYTPEKTKKETSKKTTKKDKSKEKFSDLFTGF